MMKNVLIVYILFHSFIFCQNNNLNRKNGVQSYNYEDSAVKIKISSVNEISKSDTLQIKIIIINKLKCDIAVLKKMSGGIFSYDNKYEISLEIEHGGFFQPQYIRPIEMIRIKQGKNKILFFKYPVEELVKFGCKNYFYLKYSFDYLDNIEKIPKHKGNFENIFQGEKIIIDHDYILARFHPYLMYCFGITIKD